MKRAYLILLPLSILGLFLPAAWNVYDSVALHDWQASPLFDGAAYRVSENAYVPQELDETGVAATLATLLTWQGEPTTELEVYEALAAQEFGYSLSDLTAFATSLGFEGQWLQAEPNALSQLKTPFLAHLNDGGGRFVIVRDARSGYVYATDPLRGQVLYRLEEFGEVWSGQLFAFPNPPTQPEEWR